jgi:hypothetical protein
MKRILLLTLLVFDVIGGSAAPVKAADCSANANRTLPQNAKEQGEAADG